MNSVVVSSANASCVNMRAAIHVALIRLEYIRTFLPNRNTKVTKFFTFSYTARQQCTSSIFGWSCDVYTLYRRSHRSRDSLDRTTGRSLAPLLCAPAQIFTDCSYWCSKCAVIAHTRHTITSSISVWRLFAMRAEPLLRTARTSSQSHSETKPERTIHHFFSLHYCDFAAKFWISTVNAVRL